MIAVNKKDVKIAVVIIAADLLTRRRDVLGDRVSTDEFSVPQVHCKRQSGMQRIHRLGQLMAVERHAGLEAQGVPSALVGLDGGPWPVDRQLEDGEPRIVGLTIDQWAP